jgi:thiol:disulfide interchange protein DsbD
MPITRQSPEVLARLKSLASGFSGAEEPEFLPPEEAFKVAITPAANGGLDARFTIAKDYYLYRDKIRFTVTEPAGVTVTGMDLPKADEKDDPNFGKMFVYHQDFNALVGLAGVPPGTTRLKVEATHQGCSEKGICYPPQDQSFSVDLTVDARPGGSAPPAAPPPQADTSDTGRVTAILQGGNYWLVVISFFGFGLLLSLTPCVFPMIPILSGIIVGQGHQITKRKGFLLSLAYVLGMATTYALAGVAAGLSGTLISNALQNPWALGAGAAIFVALAMSMFGFYELQMPSFLQSRFTEASNRIQGGRFASVFVMGAISALIVGPCVAAPLAGALLYISQTGDVVLGGVSLFSLAMGMGVPLLLVGLSAGALLPTGRGLDGRGQALLRRGPAGGGHLADLAPAVGNRPDAHVGRPADHLRHVPACPGAPGGQRPRLHPLLEGGRHHVPGGRHRLLLGAMGGSRDLLQPLTVYQGGVPARRRRAPTCNSSG